MALQLYRCAGQQYARAYWASLIIAKQFSGAVEVIDEYASRWKAAGPCGSGLGVMKAIALDYGAAYLLVVVLAEVDGAGADSPARAERDVDTLVSSARSGQVTVRWAERRSHGRGRDHQPDR